MKKGTDGHLRKEGDKKMKKLMIDKSRLEELYACSKAVEAFEQSGIGSIDGTALLKKTIEKGQLEWADWLIGHIAYKISNDRHLAHAISTAEEVLHIFEKQHPDDHQPRKEIEDAKKALTDGNNVAFSNDACVAASAAAVASILFNEIGNEAKSAAIAAAGTYAADADDYADEKANQYAAKAAADAAHAAYLLAFGNSYADPVCVTLLAVDYSAYAVVRKIKELREIIVINKEVV